MGLSTYTIKLRKFYLGAFSDNFSVFFFFFFFSGDDIAQFSLKNTHFYGNKMKISSNYHKNKKNWNT